jgi:hypothetical protein
VKRRTSPRLPSDDAIGSQEGPRTSPVRPPSPTATDPDPTAPGPTSSVGVRRSLVACNERITRPHSFALPPLALSLPVATSTSAISFVLGSLDQAFFNMAQCIAQCLPTGSLSRSLSRCDSLLDLVELTTASGFAPSLLSHLDLDLDLDLDLYALNRICTQSTCTLCCPPIRYPMH